MARESFNSRLCRMCYWYWQCMAFSFYYRGKWRWFLRIILFVVFGDYGTASADYGVGGRQRQPQKRGECL